MKFMTGIYIVRFKNEEEATAFVARFKCCPLWPVVSKIENQPEVFIFAREIKEQKHGDFEQENNTLVKNPELLGATQVKFQRNDDLNKLIDIRPEKYGQETANPCGTECPKCPKLENPCQGCVANKFYWQKIQTNQKKY